MHLFSFYWKIQEVWDEKKTATTIWCQIPQYLTKTRSTGFTVTWAAFHHLSFQRILNVQRIITSLSLNLLWLDFQCVIKQPDYRLRANSELRLPDVFRQISSCFTSRLLAIQLRLQSRYKSYSNPHRKHLAVNICRFKKKKKASRDA